MDSSSFFVRWSRFFLSRYRVTLLIIIAILFGGWWGVTNNQRQDFPQIDTNFIFVQATYPGASSADVEQEVAVPVEQVIQGINGVGSVRTTAANNFAFFAVEMENVPRAKEAAQELSDELATLRLPDGATTEIQPLDVTGPAVALGLVGSNGETTNTLLSYVSDVLPFLENVSPDIDRIEVVPKNEFAVTIELDAAALARNALSVETVKQTIQAYLTSLPGGQVTTDTGRKEAINITAPVQSLDDLRALPLGSVTLNDVASILRHPEDDESIHFGGYVKDGTAYSRESVYLMAYKRSDGDIIRISNALTDAVTEIQEKNILPEGVEIVTLYDTSPFIRQQITSLVQNGLWGLLIILIVLLFFINLRTALTVALAIPIAFLTTLFLLNAIGFSLNILTLFAMILTLGILIDNSIVIAEAIVHEIERGSSRYEAALIAVKKFGPAVTAATLTTVIAFVPFASLGGIVGQFLKFIPFTIIIMLVVSYFIAITVTPLFGRAFIKQQTKEQRAEKKLRGIEKMLIIPAIVFYGQNFLNWIRDKYEHRLMEKILPRTWKKIVTLVIVVVLFGVSFGVFAPMLTFEEFPTNDSTIIVVDLSFPTGTPSTERKDVFARTLDVGIGLPYFQNFYTFGDQVYMTFVDPVDRTDETTIQDIEQLYDERLASVREAINPEIEIVPSAASYGPPNAGYDMIIEFVDADTQTLAGAADDLTAFLNDQSDVAEVVNGLEELKQPAVRVALDRERVTAQGVNPLIASGTINAVFTEQEIGSFVTREDGVSDTLKLGFTADATDSVDDLQSLVVPTLTGRTVRLDSIADIESVDAPISIDRLDGRRVATVSVKLREDINPADRAAFEQTVKDYLTVDKLNELELADDGVVYGGQFATFQEDYSSLQVIFILAMIFVYLVLVNQFNSFMQPVLIMFTIPLALIGVFPGLFVVGSSLNMISGLGIIALVGVVVNDAIVFIDTFNRYRKEHSDWALNQVLAQTGHTRFKPIFSTSITTMGGILPLTIVDPFWTGLGTAIIAGLIFSTIGTLIVIPTLYSLFRREKAPTA